MSDRIQRTQPAPGQAIPIPADFLVSWDDPSDAGLLWRLDPIHYPDPLPALEHDLHQGWDAIGTTRGLENYNLPIEYKLRNFNGYVYNECPL